MKKLMIILLTVIGSIAKAQTSANGREVNPKNLVATLRNDTLFVHKDVPEFAEFESVTPREIAFNKFRKVSYYREKTIWFYYVVYDYGLFYVGENKGGREIFEATAEGRIKFVPRKF